jgi:hypothetical protein
MKNKIKKLKIFWFGLPGFVLLSFVANSYGSGTYCPPLPASWGNGQVRMEDVQKGKILFEGTQLAGPGGKTCYECHSQGQSVPLQRSSLKNKAGQLDSKINICLLDPARSAGDQLDPTSKQMVQLESYLISLYHLPNDAAKDILKK